MSTFLDRFEAQVDRTPDAPAVRFEGQTLSYGELDARANRLADALAALGVRPDARVAVAIPRSFDMVVAVLAVLKADGAYVPLDLSYPPPRLSFMLTDSRAAVVLTHARAGGLSADAGTRGIALDDPATIARIAAMKGRRRPRQAGPEHLAYVIYTSGSTGTPKGVAMVRGALDNLVTWQAGASFAHEGTVTLQFSPLSFDVHFQEMFSTWATGGTLVLVAEDERLDALRLLRLLERERVERLFLPFVALAALADVATANGITPRDLREVVTSGEQLKITRPIVTFFAALPECRLHNHYGPSETHVVTAHVLDGAPIDWPALPPIGKALPAVELHVLDADLRPVPSGGEGELFVGGVALARGYLDRPELTAERFLELPALGRVYRTGDLVRVREDGALEFLGRLDGQVKVRGFRIELGEIEVALAAHPRVAAAVAAVREDDPGDKRLVGYVVADGEAPTAAVLRVHLRALGLPEYMVPSAFVVIDRLPRTPSGKIDRRALPAPSRRRPELAAPFVAPRTPLERRIAEVWEAVVSIDGVGVHDSFFEIGGTSLLAVTVSARLLEREIDVPVVRIFEAPTIAQIAQGLERSGDDELAEVDPRAARASGGDDDPIAIVGMACRLPGARDVAELWRNLVDGVTSVTTFGDDELDRSVPLELRRDPRYVRARGILEGADLFDAGFFGVMPREAEVMDPQQRVLLEVAWEAIEHAGHTPEDLGGVVGVFAGVHNNSYYAENVARRPDVVERVGAFQAMVANEKDYVATRLAHKLGLTGPAVSVHTACSTSLVAVAEGYWSLRNGMCDVALCGGAAITFPQRTGHLYQEGGMLSGDGVCRPFDEAATGTLFSDGAAIVVLKRLSLARRDGDRVYALLKGAALNNDGANKVSFSAPSVLGQAKVIALAHAVARVDPRTIGYVEAHGTATPFGDPVEVEALTKAFRRGRSEALRGTCGIGSVKSNLGHLTAAAGVVGMLKTVLALHHEILPASLHFERPNPKIDFEAGPFYVVNERRPWPRTPDRPRRAGVSSFGVGGTNAHVVLEEAPAEPPAGPSTPRHVLLLSARSEAALERATDDLARSLAANPSTDLADVAFVLATGRRAFPFRRAVVARSAEDAAAALLQRDPQRTFTRAHDGREPAVALLFPGQGAQYVGMGKNLYAVDPSFRATIDRCAEGLAPTLGEDIRTVLFAGTGDGAEAEARLRQTAFAQSALFTVEYALASLLLAWGVAPRALAGHSVGELVAACIAGVFSLDDALRLVARRGQLMQSMPPGVMVSVRAPAEQILPRLHDGVAIASVNAPKLCVISGPPEATARIAAELEREGIPVRALHTSHAFHSSMMDAAVAPFLAEVQQVKLAPPRIPIVSTATGTWLTSEQATSADYWARHLRDAVQFSDAVRELLRASWPGTAEGGPRVLLEVGPRTTLTTLVRQQIEGRKEQAAISTLGESAVDDAEWTALLAAVGQLWTHGAALEMRRFYAGERRRRVALPTYPFEHKRFFVEPPTSRYAAAQPVHASLPASPEPRPPALRAASPSRAELPIANAMTQDPTPKYDLLVPELLVKLEEMSGIELAGSDPDASFLELGFDSLVLTQVALELQRTYGVKVTFRKLLEEVPSVRKLARMLEAAAAAAPRLAIAPVPTGDATASQVTYDVKKAFGAIARISLEKDEITETQRNKLAELTRAYNARTRRSKEYAARHREHLADPRVVTGFRPQIKELIYPIVMQRADGARMIDLDGNEYVDALNGFGSSMFGNRAPFVVKAIEEQLARGYEIGPQHPLAGEVAELVCELTGAERAGLCNTGSEAVLGCMRIARTVTGRSTIAIFSGSYHGIADEVLVRGTKTLRSIPAAPGVPLEAVKNVLVLDYGTDESLAILRERAHDLAAIMVEPVQSRRPDFQPGGFLRALRGVCDEGRCAYIFDEVITGFRVGPGGAQQYFGVRADLASYGKVVGGGQPIGVIAGKREWMDALDGGHWQYGDASAPTVGVTYFAGTFVRHPFALAAAKACLEHMKAEGPRLQARLDERTAEMARTLNEHFAAIGVPLVIKHFSSLWKAVYTTDLAWGDLLFCFLRNEGLHIWDGFPCFLTTAHTDEDIAFIVNAFVRAVAEMQAGGFLPKAPSEENAHVAAPPPDLPGVVPTTEAQREIWTAVRLNEEGSCAFNESVSITLFGALDATAMTEALRAVVARHQALRSTVSADGLELHVTPASRFSLDLRVDDLADLTPATAKEGLEAIAVHEVTEPFALERGPLFRARLVKLAPQRHVLVLSGHHVVLDGWSMAVIVRDLGALYTAALSGRSDAGLPLAPTFAEYSRITREARGSKAFADAIAYFTTRFDGQAPVLELPTDFPRPAVRSLRSRRVDHVLDPELVRAAKRVGGRHGASVFVTMLAAFSAFLCRLANQEEVVVGIPAAGQNATGMADLVGHCVNTLPIRVGVPVTDSFAAILERTRGAVLDAYEHQSVTFGELLKRLPIPRDASRLPLVSVLFNVDQGVGGPTKGFCDLEGTVATNPRVFENFDLFVNATESQGRIILETQYATDLFEERTIASWLCAFEVFLREVIEDPGITAANAPLVGPDAREELLARSAATERPYPRDACLHDLFARTVERSPDRVAVLTTDGASATFAELHRRATALAAHLRARGIGPGTLVGLHMERDVGMLVALWGILASGAAYVPLDPGFPRARLAFMCADSRMPCLVTERALAADARALASEAREAGASTTIDVVVVEDVTEDVPEDVEARVAEDGRADASSGASPTPEDPAYVIYTSGSTGTPKGVVIPHRAVINFLFSVRDTPGLVAADVLLAVTTLSFDIAVLELCLPLVVGATIVLASRDVASDGRSLLDAIARFGATTMQATPSTYRLLLEAGWKGGAPSKILVGGEALPLELGRELAGRANEVWNMYGPTETTVWSTCWRVPKDARRILIGRPLANTRIYVLDGAREPRPVGVPGEICIGGDGVALGYHERAPLTRERFVPDPFAGGTMYRTGDLGRLTHDGELEYLRRNDGQVKVRGYRIELGEVEHALAAHPHVRQAVALVREDRSGDARLVAYLVPTEGEEPGEAELRKHLRRQLPDYMIPQHFVVLESFPLTPNEKIDRRALPPPRRGASDQERTPPRTAAETLVGGVFKEVLGIAEVGVRDRFFEIGGHSLLAIRVVAEIEKRTGVRLSPRLLLLDSLEQLAGHLEAEAGGTLTTPCPDVSGAAERPRKPAPSSSDRVNGVKPPAVAPGRSSERSKTVVSRMLARLIGSRS